MKIIAFSAHDTGDQGQKNTKHCLKIGNSEDPRDHPLDGVDSIELDFPKFTDGRAFSQAFLLSNRLGFKGEIVATGDVLMDQLAQMQRSGFTAAVLRADQPLDVANRVFNAHPAYEVGAYQGDAVHSHPHFLGVHS